jgi:hypothetical protein
MRSRRQRSSRSGCAGPHRSSATQQILRWDGGVAISAGETLKKRRLKQLLA